MSTKKFEGRDVITGRNICVTVESGFVQRVELVDSESNLPWISHGLIDLQVNGYGGVDLNSPALTVADISSITDLLAQQGTTNWIPTIITQSHEHISAILRVIAAAVIEDPAVASAIQCAHIEGPFISPLDGPRGAHDERFVRDISVAEILAWQSIFPIGYITLSPHWKGSSEKISALRRLGVHVSIGHTHATAREVADASAAGATLSTHLGNGMKSEIDRHPNLLWEQISDRSLNAGLIADGHHLPPSVIESIVRAKGSDQCYLVSDSVALAGSPAGRYVTPIGGEVTLSNSKRLSLTHDSRLLAGSAVSLADCIRFAAEGTQLALTDLFAMATKVPGRILADLSSRPPIGDFTPGIPANLAIWNDNLTLAEVVTPNRGQY